MSATTKRPPSSHALAAKMIRTTLKATYPNTTFQITSKSYSGGSSISIHWQDGPTSDAVDKLVGMYEKGHFDGMIDLYEYTNSRDDIPQVYYVHTQRSHSPATLVDLVARLNQRRGYALKIDKNGWIETASDAPIPNGGGWQSHEIWRLFSPISLVCEHCKTNTQLADMFCPECGNSLTTKETL